MRDVGFTSRNWILWVEIWNKRFKTGIRHWQKTKRGFLIGGKRPIRKWIENRSIYSKSYLGSTQCWWIFENWSNMENGKFWWIMFKVDGPVKVSNKGSRRWNRKFWDKHFENPNPELLLHSSNSSSATMKNCEKHFLYFFAIFSW